MTWIAGASYKGLYLISLTLYKSNGGWRVKRELKLRAKRTSGERTLFVEDYSLPEFQAILEACQALISGISVDEGDRHLALALRALTIINSLIDDLRGVSK